MNIKIVIFVIFLVTTSFLYGCLEKKESNSKNSIEEVSNDKTNKTVYMNAQELIEDFEYSISFKAGSTKWIWGYKSLNDGDTLVLNETISNIQYNETILYNSTNISFNVDSNKSNDFDNNFLNLLFEGNLTNKFSVGDKVKITVTIEEFIYGNDTSSKYFEIDVFKEGWNADEFLSNQTGFSVMSLFGSFLQILPESCIEKI